jgi:hypothetical protein
MLAKSVWRVEVVEVVSSRLWMEEEAVALSSEA